MQFKVNYYSLSPRRAFAGTQNSFGFEYLELLFSEEWARLKKSVTFYTDGEPITLDYKSPILIPKEVFERSGVSSFTVQGESEGKRLVTLTGYLDVLPSGKGAEK